VLLSATADNIEHVISYWVIFQAFHSPMLAGFAVISHWMPFLLFSVYAGALADRFDCRKLIQISQGLFALASLAWALLFLTGTLRVWHAAVILLIHGAAGVIGLPAWQLLVYDIVGPEQLELTQSGHHRRLTARAPVTAAAGPTEAYAAYAAGSGPRPPTQQMRPYRPPVYKPAVVRILFRCSSM